MEDNMRKVLESEKGQAIKGTIFRVGQGTDGSRMIMLLNDNEELLAWMHLDPKGSSNLAYMLINQYKTSEA